MVVISLTVSVPVVAQNSMSSESEDNDSLMPQPVKKNETGNPPQPTVMAIRINRFSREIVIALLVLVALRASLVSSFFTCSINAEVGMVKLVM